MSRGKLHKKLLSGVFFTLLLFMPAGVFAQQVRESRFEFVFAHGTSRLDFAYRDNTQQLSQLDNLLRNIEADPTRSVVSIEVDGSSSPAQGLTRARNISGERIKALQAYLDRYLADKNVAKGVRITHHNKAIDWANMLELVNNSGASYRRSVANIINHVPEETWRYVSPNDRWRTLTDSRNKHLMDLSGGDPYRDMQRRIFPLMCAGGITIKYVDNANVQRATAPAISENPYPEVTPRAEFAASAFQTQGVSSPSNTMEMSGDTQSITTQRVEYDGDTKRTVTTITTTTPKSPARANTSSQLAMIPKGYQETFEIWYENGDITINPRYKNNATTLRKLDELLYSIESGANSSLMGVDIEATSSPDGGVSANRVVIDGRVKNLVGYVLQHNVSPSLMREHRLGIAWEQLDNLVLASGASYKYDVSYILNNTDEEVWAYTGENARWKTLVASRNNRLMELGAPYHDMAKYLFPALRVGRIGVNYVIYEEQVSEPAMLVTGRTVEQELELEPEMLIAEHRVQAEEITAEVASEPIEEEAPEQVEDNTSELAMLLALELANERANEREQRRNKSEEQRRNKEDEREKDQALLDERFNTLRQERETEREQEQERLLALQQEREAEREEERERLLALEQERILEREQDLERYNSLLQERDFDREQEQERMLALEQERALEREQDLERLRVLEQERISDQDRFAERLAAFELEREAEREEERERLNALELERAAEREQQRDILFAMEQERVSEREQERERLYAMEQNNATEREYDRERLTALEQERAADQERFAERLAALEQERIADQERFAASLSSLEQAHAAERDLDRERLYALEQEHVTTLEQERERMYAWEQERAAEREAEREQLNARDREHELISARLLALEQERAEEKERLKQQEMERMNERFRELEQERVNERLRNLELDNRYDSRNDNRYYDNRRDERYRDDRYYDQNSNRNSQPREEEAAPSDIPQAVTVHAEEEVKPKEEVANTPMKRPFLAVKTNLIYDLASAFCVELEVPMGRKWSMSGEWVFPWWNFTSSLIEEHYALQLLNANFELKRWMGNREGRLAMTGWYLGVHAGVGIFDVEYKSEGYQGEFSILGGLSLGYAHRLTRRGNLRMEYSVGAGYVDCDYTYYIVKENAFGNMEAVRMSTGSYQWFGPTRAKASLVWVLNYKK